MHGRGERQMWRPDCMLWRLHAPPLHVVAPSRTPIACCGAFMHPHCMLWRLHAPPSCSHTARLRRLAHAGCALDLAAEHSTVQSQSCCALCSWTSCTPCIPCAAAGHPALHRGQCIERVRVRGMPGPRAGAGGRATGGRPQVSGAGQGMRECGTCQVGMARPECHPPPNWMCPWGHPLPP